MSIAARYDLIIARELTLALRLTPMMDGYTVRIQVGSYQGPCPRFEKHFPPDKPVCEAIDTMARYPLQFFRWGGEARPKVRITIKLASATGARKKSRLRTRRKFRPDSGATKLSWSRL